ncbi:ABC transporter substrate-binding protein [Bosea sp. (in: a-proteobacteria)]
MLDRRQILKSSAALAVGGIAAPKISRAQAPSVLKFVPQADLSLLDPIQTPVFVTRNHAFMVYDMLYGVDENLVARPQMVEGHLVENDGLTWKLTLRDGLRFHDGQPVLARDAVASIRRWGKRDLFAQGLMEATVELSAPSDKVIQFRLHRPFRLLPDALGKPISNICPIMPERFANLDPSQQVTEVVGSGPFRFVANERVPGSLSVYEKFTGYVPRAGERTSFLAGPKVAHIDRVEWHTMPDAATASAALMSGEIDWWEQPLIDLLPALRQKRDLRASVLDDFGNLCLARLNTLHPPFDDPVIRRIVLRAIRQADIMAAVAGGDPEYAVENVGFFAPGSRLDSPAGKEALNGERDYAKLKAELLAAGYDGKPIIFLSPGDYPTIFALAEVLSDVMRKIGFSVDYQVRDWSTVVQRAASKEPPEKGGWHVFVFFTAALASVNPAGHTYLRGNGQSSVFGWPSIPKLEELRTAWFNATDDAQEKTIGNKCRCLPSSRCPMCHLATSSSRQPTLAG